jgi:hypothetical protein
MHVTGYFQSFKDNGMPNAFGKITLNTERPNLLWIKKWDPKDGWEKIISEVDGTLFGDLELDGNGALAGVFKTNAYHAAIFDSEGAFMRSFDFNSYEEKGWDDELWDRKIEEATGLLEKLNDLPKPSKVYCKAAASGGTPTADLTGKRGLLMAINDSGREGIAKWTSDSGRQRETPLKDGRIAVFIGTGTGLLSLQ